MNHAGAYSISPSAAGRWPVTASACEGGETNANTRPNRSGRRYLLRWNDLVEGDPVRGELAGRESLENVQVGPPKRLKGGRFAWYSCRDTGLVRFWLHRWVPGLLSGGLPARLSRLRAEETARMAILRQTAAAWHQGVRRAAAGFRLPSPPVPLFGCGRALLSPGAPASLFRLR